MKPILVLLYHGVTDDLSCRENSIRNYNSKHLDKTIFEYQIQKISKVCNIVSMDNLVENWIENREFKGPTALVTFDDGFKNNFNVAIPILEKYNIPSIFYISTGNINKNKLFWVDQLELLFDNTKINQINLENTPTLFKLSSFKGDNLVIHNRNEKIYLLNVVKKCLKLYSPRQRNEIIKTLFLELEISDCFKAEDCHHDYSLLTWKEIAKMDLNPLVTIGGHSRWHNILSKLTGKELKNEISGSIQDLNNNLDSFSGHYAYPEGQPEHFNLETQNVLRDNGVKACPSAIQGFTYMNKHSLFDFPRIMVGIDPTSNTFINDFLQNI